MLNLSNEKHTLDYFAHKDYPGRSIINIEDYRRKPVILNKNQGVLCSHQIIHRGNKVNHTAYLHHLNFGTVPDNIEINQLED